jgi:hypothetical protein
MILKRVSTFWPFVFASLPSLMVRKRPASSKARWLIAKAPVSPELLSL